LSHVFATHDLAAVSLDHGDVPRLQALFERCDEFIQLIYRRPVDAREATSLLESLPPDKEIADKFVLGLETANGDLAGVLELVRNFPDEGDWFLGLLLLDPRHRGKGAGTRVMDALEAWLLAEGAESVLVAVQDQNGPARRFWERRGYGFVHEIGKVHRLRKRLSGA